MAISTFTQLLSSVCASGSILGFCGFLWLRFCFVLFLVVGIFNSTVQCLCTPGTVNMHYLGGLFLVNFFPPFIHHNCKIESGLEFFFIMQILFSTSLSQYFNLRVILI